MKKVISIVVVITMLMMLMSNAVFATGEGMLVISTGSATVKSGETATITLTVTSNPGVQGLVLGLSYDTSVLTLDSAASSNGSIFDSFTAAKSLLWDASTNSTKTGTLATLSFTVAEGAAPGNYTVSIITVADGCYNSAFEMIPVSVNNATITVECPHKNTKDVAEQPAGCTEAGYTAGVFCEDCQTYLSGHQEIGALGHQEVVDEAIPATCDTPGMTEGKHCQRCEKVLVEQTVIPAWGHKDDNHDHTCDNGCGKTDMGEHTDSSTDNDHVCDHGCGAVLEDCSDKADDGDHKCDACGKENVTEHTYAPASCEAPETCTECGLTAGEALGHADENHDHICDRNCGKADVGAHSDSATDSDHVCDYGCGATLENCADQTGDENHNCDVCGKEGVTEHTYGNAACDKPAVCTECGLTTGEALGHADENRDHICDRNCGKTDMGEHADATTDGDHVCDYGCGAVLEDCADQSGDENHTCDVCGKEGVTEHAYGNASCDQPATCTECGLTTGEALGHDFASYTSNGDATCTTDGTETATCTRCGKTDTRKDEGSALGHDFAVYTSNNDATCTADGTKTAQCTRCDQKDTVADEGTALGHDFTTYISNGDATCTADGTKTAQCSRCDKTDTKADEGSALGHKEVTDAAVPATCTEPGLTEGKHCERCSEVLVKQNTVAALGHDEVIDKAVEPTCAATGLTEGKHCDRCKAVLVAQNVIPATGKHVDDNGAWETDGTNHWHICGVCNALFDKAAHTGGTANCTEQAKCSVCGAGYGELNKDYHDFGDWEIVEEPSADSDGLMRRECSRCGHFEEAPAHHIHVYEVHNIAPTCTMHGSVVYICTVENCGFKYVDYVPATGHTEVVEPGAAATCTQPGYTESKICSVCNEILATREELPALGHKEVIDAAVAATCTGTGLTEGKHCEVCGEVLVAQEVLPVLEHTYESVVTEPTCAASGYTTHTCSVCGDSYKDSATAKREHNWDDGVLIVEPTCEGLGTKLISCQYDDCDACFEDKLVPALGHTINAWTVTKPATCMAEGEETGTCELCGGTATRAIASNGVHNYKVEVTKSATETEEGEKTYTCPDCGDVKVEKTGKLQTSTQIISGENKLETDNNSTAQIDPETELIVEKVEQDRVPAAAEGSIQQKVDAKAEILEVYNISLLLDGQEVQPGGLVKITISVPETAGKRDTLVVVFVDDDGNITPCHTVRNADGTLTFETDHFSYYAVVAVPASNAGLIVGIVAAVVVIAAAAFLFLKKKKA